MGTTSLEPIYGAAAVAIYLYKSHSFHKPKERLLLCGRNASQYIKHPVQMPRSLSVSNKNTFFKLNPETFTKLPDNHMNNKKEKENKNMKNKKFTTKHSTERAEERLALNSRQASKDFKNAWQYGKRSSDLYGKPNRTLELKAQNDHIPVYYHNNIYIFSADKKCITVFRAPKYFNNQYCGKSTIRSIVKYNRMSDGNIGRRTGTPAYVYSWSDDLYDYDDFGDYSDRIAG